VSDKLKFVCHCFADEVEIKFDADKAWLVNNEYGTQPLVAHGNGASKVEQSNVLILQLNAMQCSLSVQFLLYYNKIQESLFRPQKKKITKVKNETCKCVVMLRVGAKSECLAKTKTTLDTVLTEQK